MSTLTTYGTGTYQTQVPSPDPAGAGGDAIAEDIKVLTDAANALDAAVTAAQSTANNAVSATATQAAHAALMGPASGSPAAPTFRPLVASDLPSTASFASLSVTTTAAGTSELSLFGVTSQTAPHLLIKQAPTTGTGHYIAGQTGGGADRWHIDSSGTFFTTGNVQAQQFIGGGSQLSGITTTQIGALAAAGNLSDLSDLSQARANLGLGDMAYQQADSVSITGGTITGMGSLDVSGTITAGVNDPAAGSGFLTLHANLADSQAFTIHEVSGDTNPVVIGQDGNAYFAGGVTADVLNANSVTATTGGFSSLTASGTGFLTLSGKIQSGQQIALVNTNSQSSGSTSGIGVSTTYAQSGGSTSNTDLLIQTSGTRGSGTQLLADFQVNSVSKWKVDTTGNVTMAGRVSASDSSTITKAGIGTTSTDGLLLTNTTTGTAQYSPRIRFHANAIDTGNANANYPIDLRLEARGVSNNFTGSVSTVVGALSVSANNAAYQDVFQVNQFGAVSSGTNWTFNGVTAGAFTASSSAVQMVCNNYASTNNGTPLTFSVGNFTGTATTAMWSLYNKSGTTVSNSSGQTYGLIVCPTVSQTGTATMTDLLVSRFPSSLTSTGAQLLMDLGTNSAQQGTGTHTSKLKVDVAGKITSAADSLNVTTSKTPATSTATGTAGDICWDSGFVYVCTATNTWKRAALSTW